MTCLWHLPLLSLQAARLREHAQAEEQRHREQEAERRRQQEAELRRVEEEKRRALGLQRRERELRQRLMALLLARRPGDPSGDPSNPGADPGSGDRVARADDLLRPVIDMLRGVARGRMAAVTGRDLPTGSDPQVSGGGAAETGSDAMEARSGEKLTGSDFVVTGSGVEAGSDIIEGKGDASEAGIEVRAAGKERGPDDAAPKAPPPAADAIAAWGSDLDQDGVGKEPLPPSIRKPREGWGAGDEEGGDRERRRGREKDKEHGGRDRKRGRRHREDREHERSRSRSPRHHPTWSR